MKVKTLKPHNNGYGDKFEKAEGDEYELPAQHAAPLIDAGLIEEGGEAPAKPAGKSSGKPAGGNDADS